MNKYFLRTVSSTEGKIRLAVVYNGDFSENSPVNVELYNGDTNESSDIISQDNTGVLLSPLCANTSYTLKISEKEKVQHLCFTTSEDGKTIQLDCPSPDDITVMLNAIAPMAAAATTFSTYSSASAASPVGVYASLFQAIDRARQAGTGAVVKMNGTSEVYRHGQSGRYYKYQFTASYGYTTSLTDVNNWLNGYLYTYVITSSNARF